MRAMQVIMITSAHLVIQVQQSQNLVSSLILGVLKQTLALAETMVLIPTQHFQIHTTGQVLV